MIPSGPFTPEQEARIAEIVASILLNLNAEENVCRRADLKQNLTWALHNAGFDQSGKRDD